MELPELLKKQLATTKVKAHKYRGVQPTGPKPRLRKGDTARARVRRSIGMRNANPDDPKFAALLEDEKKKKIPSVQDVPFHKKDFRYNRVEETLDDESKAVIFFVLDRSGSMGGDPLMIAKAFFVLNLMFLRNKYKDVKVVMIAHDDRGWWWHCRRAGLSDGLRYRSSGVSRRNLEPLHVPGDGRRALRRR
jgi:uncharacterized sporulation protein YeaH/YhbH (DUF444 family)